VVNLVAVIVAPIVVGYELDAIGWVVVAALVAILAWAIWSSKQEAPAIAALPAGGGSRPAASADGGSKPVSSRPAGNKQKQGGGKRR
jgi:hypothetical protein